MPNSHTWHTDCLYSKIKNSSGGTLVLSFLPPHGRTLAANQVISILGPVEAAIAQGDQIANQRQLDAYLAAVTRGDIELIQTPSPIVTDLTSGLPKVLVSTNGVLSAVDPCWATSIS